MAFTYEYPHPAVTVDIVLFGYEPGSPLEVLLIERASDPYKGRWAIPGGFVDYDEDLDEAASRELHEETGIRKGRLSQVGTFGKPGRDPRERIITVACTALVSKKRCRKQAGSDARHAEWFSVGRLPKLAFDHSKILKLSYRQLVRDLTEEPRLYQMLPREFTLPEARDLFSVVFRNPFELRKVRSLLIQSGAMEVKSRSKTGEKLYTLPPKAFKPLGKQAFGHA